MSFKKFLFLIIIAFASCESKQSSTSVENKPTDYEQILKAKESTLQKRDSIGALISTIDFDVRATNKHDLEIFEDGIVPWISLENPDEEIPQLIDAEKIVLPFANPSLLLITR